MKYEHGVVLHPDPEENKLVIEIADALGVRLQGVLNEKGEIKAGLLLAGASRFYESLLQVSEDRQWEPETMLKVKKEGTEH